MLISLKTQTDLTDYNSEKLAAFKSLEILCTNNLILSNDLLIYCPVCRHQYSFSKLYCSNCGINLIFTSFTDESKKNIVNEKLLSHLKSIPAYSTDPIDIFIIGLINFHLREFDQAFEKFEQCLGLSIDSSLTAYYYLLTNLYQNDFGNSIFNQLDYEEIEKASVILTKNPNFTLGTAVVEFVNGLNPKCNLDDKVYFFLSAIENNSKITDMHKIIGRCYLMEKEEPDKAIDYYFEYIKEHQTDESTISEIISCLMDLEDFEKALEFSELYCELVKIYEKSETNFIYADGLFKCSIQLFNLGRVPEAMEYLGRANEASPSELYINCMNTGIISYNNR